MGTNSFCTEASSTDILEKDRQYLQFRIRKQNKTNSDKRVMVLDIIGLPLLSQKTVILFKNVCQWPALRLHE
jgi:hypothetical protein